MKQLYYLFRVNHYIKNLLVFAPLLFTSGLSDLSKLALSFKAFIIFSLIASVVYIINDLFDIKFDKKHPQKRKLKPLASGKISISFAYFSIAILSIISIFILLNNKNLINVFLIYIIMNVLYSFFLKFIPILDSMKQYQNNRNTLLDIGCSVGNFISLAKEYGWKVDGIELNKNAHNVCLSKGLNVYNEKIEALDLASKYSVISLFALIEHLHAPDLMISSIKKNLAKEGLILLFFPDWNWDWEHPQVNGRAHLWYFNENTIKLFLQRHGIKIEDTWTINWLKGPKRIVVASMEN